MEAYPPEPQTYAVKQSPDKSIECTRRHVSNGVWVTDTAIRNYTTHVIAKAFYRDVTLSDFAVRTLCSACLESKNLFFLILQRFLRFVNSLFVRLIYYLYSWP